MNVSGSQTLTKALYSASSNTTDNVYGALELLLNKLTRENPLQAGIYNMAKGQHGAAATLSPSSHSGRPNNVSAVGVNLDQSMVSLWGASDEMDDNDVGKTAAASLSMPQDPTKNF
jgi:hypothetical protein